MRHALHPRPVMTRDELTDLFFAEKSQPCGEPSRWWAFGGCSVLLAIFLSVFVLTDTLWSGPVQDAIVEDLRGE